MSQDTDKRNDPEELKEHPERYEPPPCETKKPKEEAKRDR